MNIVLCCSISLSRITKVQPEKLISFLNGEYSKQSELISLCERQTHSIMLFTTFENLIDTMSGASQIVKVSDCCHIISVKCEKLI